MSSNSDKLVLVTGASRGIGYAVAEQFVAEGYRVVGTATSAKGLDNFAKLAPGVVLDVSSADSIEQALSTIQQEHGALPDILVNNAGITRDNLAMRLQDSDWDEVIATNLSGAFRLTRACLRPMMKKRWGRIVNISSIVALTGNPGQANYAASKAGLIGLSKSIALELASRGITVNVVAPGFVESDMTNKLSEEQRAKLLAYVPLNRMGAAKEIAAAVNFLASDLAGYITGETLHVNGGMLMN